MRIYIALGLISILMAIVAGCWYRYSRDYYNPKGLSNIEITYLNGTTKISFREMPESVYYASGAQIIDENASQIIVSIVREHFQLKREAQYRTQGTLDTGHFVEIPNPKNKVCIIQ